ncbi:hypothetical protein F4806DRAFT_105412 [Annulohypoxylon nitens]|nr:hypothetical protein F4806DRAFT_105412 [Annulohypoxylon nitens]
MDNDRATTVVSLPEPTPFFPRIPPGNPNPKINYVKEIAQEASKRVHAYKPDHATVNRLSNALCELLGALTLDPETASQMDHNVVAFIHKQRRAIAASFKDIYAPRSRWAAKIPNFERDYSVPTHNNAELQKHSKDLDPADNPFENREGLNPIETKQYQQFISTNPCFCWLLDCLQREVRFSTTEAYIIDEIRDQIRSGITSMEPTIQAERPRFVKVAYMLDWDILKFLRTQEYELPDADAIANAITLTGSTTQAQALSCCDYLVQMWPHTGHHTLKCLQGALRNDGDYEESFVSPSSLSISIKVYDSSVSVKVSGVNTELVVEIGEQLAWLGAALQPLSSGSGVSCCAPAVSFDVLEQVTNFAVRYKNENHIFEHGESGQEPNGRCWHNLFANTMVVRGYPINKRHPKDTGMESSLEMLVALTGSRYIDTFKSKVFIKGFSTMLIPTKRLDDILIWHLVQSDNPSQRISYLDCNIKHVDVKIEDLKRYRHVLGWCSDAISIVGTTQAKYDIKTSGLSRPHSHYTWEKAEISGGQFVTGTAVISLGNRERPVHISRSGYPTKLQWISSQFFVLWDEGEKRGWLVNGASVLLHILRSSLIHSRQKLQSAWLLDPSALQDADGEPRSNSALKVLLDEQNRDLRLFIDRTEVYDEETKDQHVSRLVSTKKTRYYRLEDRVEHIYNILEKLIDHQVDVEGRSGWNIKIRPRRQLEGWDFNDLAMDGDPFHPRVSHLQTIGKGWVDFIGALHAVTLFGRGFGELIRPQSSKGKERPCPMWSTVPSNKYYLTACVLDLQEIMQRDGDPNSNPRRLCENVVWYMKQATFGLCPCTVGRTQKHHDPVQILFPLNFWENFKRKPQVGLESQGAVIFGHNISFSWHWEDYGPMRSDLRTLRPSIENRGFRDLLLSKSKGAKVSRART